VAGPGQTIFFISVSWLNSSSFPTIQLSVGEQIVGLKFLFWHEIQWSTLQKFADLWDTKCLLTGLATLFLRAFHFSKCPLAPTDSSQDVSCPPFVLPQNAESFVMNPQPSIWLKTIIIKISQAAILSVKLTCRWNKPYKPPFHNAQVSSKLKNLYIKK
jgi:hypothetical protein